MPDPPKNPEGLPPLPADPVHPKLRALLIWVNAEINRTQTIQEALARDPGWNPGCEITYFSDLDRLYEYKNAIITKMRERPVESETKPPASELTAACEGSKTPRTIEVPAEPNRRESAEERRLKVKDMIDSLLEFKLWGVAPDEIARRAGIHVKTLYRYLKHATVRETWDRYRRQSAGKKPANLDALGDGEAFGFSLLRRD
jgi:hypothetical protein